MIIPIQATENHLTLCVLGTAECLWIGESEGVLNKYQYVQSIKSSPGGKVSELYTEFQSTDHFLLYVMMTRPSVSTLPLDVDRCVHVFVKRDIKIPFDNADYMLSFIQPSMSQLLVFHFMDTEAKSIGGYAGLIVPYVLPRPRYTLYQENVKGEGTSDSKIVCVNFSSEYT